MAQTSRRTLIAALATIPSVAAVSAPHHDAAEINRLWR